MDHWNESGATVDGKFLPWKEAGQCTEGGEICGSYSILSTQQSPYLVSGCRPKKPIPETNTPSFAAVWKECWNRPRNWRVRSPADFAKDSDARTIGVQGSAVVGGLFSRLDDGISAIIRMDHEIGKVPERTIPK